MADSPVRPTRSDEWFDSHCHIHDERIPDGADGAVAAAREAGVQTMVTVGCDRATSLAAIEVAARFDDVHATVGLHPHEASNGVDSIVDLLDTPGIVAVGEAGLDYYYDHSPRDVQQRRVRRADPARPRAPPPADHPHPRRLGRHVRHPPRRGRPRAHGLPLLHRRSRRGAARASTSARTLSFSGIVTFKGAPEVQEAARAVPARPDAVETDSPYLAPIPHRGKPNRPAWVPHVGRFIADLRGLDADGSPRRRPRNAGRAVRL